MTESTAPPPPLPVSPWSRVDAEARAALVGAWSEIAEILEGIGEHDLANVATVTEVLVSGGRA